MKIKIKINILILFLFLVTSFVCGQNDNIQPTDTIDGMAVFSIAEKMPDFIGGQESLMKYIVEHIKYPTLYNNESLQTKIVITFVIDTVGIVRNPFIQRSIHKDFDTEFLKVIENMPKWSPGINNGKKVPVRYYLPININWQ